MGEPYESGRFESGRLSFSPLSGRDLDEMHALWTRPEVLRFLFDGESINREKAGELLRRSERDFEERGHGLWSLRSRDEAGIAGFCGLFPVGDRRDAAELVYGLAPEFWGRGLATEAARAAIRFAFERAKLSKVIASADEPNAASIKVMERAGMRFTRRETRETGGGILVHYEMEVGEWRKATSSPG